MPHVFWGVPALRERWEWSFPVSPSLFSSGFRTRVCCQYSAEAHGPHPPAVSLPPCTLAAWPPWARDTVSSPQETLCLDSLLLHCSWDTLGFERCVTISASVFLGTWLTAFWEYIEFAQRHVRHCFTIKFKFRFSPLQGQVSLYKWQLDEQKPFVCKGLCSRAVMPAASTVCSTQMRASYPASSASRVPGLFWARRAAPPPRFACPAVRHALATHCWPFLSFSSRLLLTCSFSWWDPFCWGLQLVPEFREPQMSISVSKPCIGFLLIPSWVADVWNLTQPVYPQLKLLDPECPIFLPLPSSPHTLLR